MGDGSKTNDQHLFAVYRFEFEAVFGQALAHDMSSNASSARAPLLGGGGINTHQDQPKQLLAAPDASSGSRSDAIAASWSGQFRSSTASNTAQQDQTEDHDAENATSGSSTPEKMKYRRFRTPVNFVMFRTPTLRTQATQINTINGRRKMNN